MGMHKYLTHQEQLEHRRAAVKRYALANPEVIKERYRKWVGKNRDKKNALASAYRSRNRSSITERQFAWLSIPKNRMRSMVSSRMGDCRRRRIPFDKEALRELITTPPTHCSFCNVLLNYSVGTGYQNDGPSIDRVVPSKGYIKGNITMLCRLCNTIKGGATAAQHRAFADFMDKFR